MNILFSEFVNGSAYASLSNHDETDNNSLLYKTANKDHKEVAKILLCEVSKYYTHNYPQNEDRQSLLHLAVQRRYLESVKWFISQGADINAKNRFGATPLYMAVSEGRMEIIQ
ncbi:ankyrin repeat domain-containing protein, partial [Candidatus Cardinium sp. cBcalN1]|uniref:ankyrin repeat domain-containing protein n=1 Tax=Candidatus Cardinium sp. cBcalN1 TaxID=2699437 RepID=UPI001FB39E11